MDLILNAMETQKCFDHTLHLHNERNRRMTDFNQEYTIRNNDHNSNKN